MISYWCSSNLLNNNVCIFSFSRNSALISPKKILSCMINAMCFHLTCFILIICIVLCGQRAKIMHGGYCAPNNSSHNTSPLHNFGNKNGGSDTRKNSLHNNNRLHSLLQHCHPQPTIDIKPHSLR